MGWGEGRTLATGLPTLAGEEYVACVPDDSSGAVALVAFSAAPEGPLAPEACGALCFAAGQALAALSEQGRCLCGSAQPHNSSSACLPSCSGPSLPPAPACRGPSLLQHVFPASPGAALLGPQGPLASGQPAAFHVTASLPVSSTHWDFGDGSPEVDVAGPDATHRYVLPGRYPVTAVLALGAGSARLGAEVRVEAAPADLELVCVASVHSDETLQLGVRNRGGSGLEAAYSIVALGEEPAQGGACPGHVGWADCLGWAHADACLCPLPQWCTRSAPRTRRSSPATGTATACGQRRRPGRRRRSSAGLGPGPPWPWWTALPCSTSWSPASPGAWAWGICRGCVWPAGGLQAAAAPVGSPDSAEATGVPAVVVARPRSSLSAQAGPLLQRAGQVWCGQCLPHPRSLLGALTVQACGGLCSAAVTRGGPAGPLLPWVPVGRG